MKQLLIPATDQRTRKPACARARACTSVGAPSRARVLHQRACACAHVFVQWCTSDACAGTSARARPLAHSAGRARVRACACACARARVRVCALDRARARTLVSGGMGERTPRALWARVRGCARARMRACARARWSSSPASAATSIGSPRSSPLLTDGMATREWHAARTMAAATSASATACCGGHEPAPACVFTSVALSRCLSEATVEAAGSVMLVEALTMPIGTSLSDVSVPVLSKKTASTCYKQRASSRAWRGGEGEESENTGRKGAAE
eukprot:5643340-Pleurochrysis_carterae.AAC.1